MTTKNFNVKNGLTTGNITLDAASANITTTGNINAAGDIAANSFIGDGSQLANIISSGGTAEFANSAGTVTANAQPNITSVGPLTSLSVVGPANLGDVGNVHIAGGNASNFLQTDGNGNQTWAQPAAFVTSSITNLVAGSAIDISIDYANTSYPAGVFTINQLGPVSLGVTDVWQGGTATKNAYANYIANTINTQNVAITLTLANANFTIQSSDSISIGGSSVTGANLALLGILGTGNTYTIPSSYFSSTVQTNSTAAVTVSLTTSRGVKTGSGTTLTNSQPTPFNVTALTGSFPAGTVPYWSLNQTFNWSAAVTGTVASGNVTYGGNATGSLTALGATSGVSPSVDSTLGYTITSSDYTGAGLNGAGTRVIPAVVTGTIAVATKYYPLFWKTTANSTIPSFTTADSHNSNNFASGQGANTTTSASSYLWMATPNATSHTFKHIFLGSDIVDTPDVSGNITISGQAYRVWGFTTFSQVTTILTTS